MGDQGHVVERVGWVGALHLCTWERLRASILSSSLKMIMTQNPYFADSKGSFKSHEVYSCTQVLHNVAHFYLIYPYESTKLLNLIARQVNRRRKSMSSSFSQALFLFLGPDFLISWTCCLLGWMWLIDRQNQIISCHYCISGNGKPREAGWVPGRCLTRWWPLLWLSGLGLLMRTQPSRSAGLSLTSAHGQAPLITRQLSTGPQNT